MAGGRTPGVMVMPERSVILWVRQVNFSELNVPAEVRRTRWKVYSVSIAKPLIFVLSISVGRGIEPALAPFRYSERDFKEAVARFMGSHSRTREVCVAFLRRRTGGEGELMP